uniref:Aminopeptidase n=1 Tax=Ciona intestinalis TaxID=7719 RepID=H2XYF3_CIOIN
PWMNSRLPNTLLPIHYNVKIRPVLDIDVASSTYLFYGSSTVQYLCNVSTDYIIMHSHAELIYDNEIKIFEDKTSSEVTVESNTPYRPNQYIVIKTSSPCVVGDTYTMVADSFHGELGDDLTGIYRSEYDNEFGEHRVIAISQMETTGARHTFPCFDEPGFKATFNITLYHNKPGFYSIANMPPIGSWVNVWTATKFDTTPIMSTYLLALVVCDFLYEHGVTATGVQTRIYSRPETIKNDEGKFPSEISPGVLDVLATHFNVTYPLPKSDQMAVSDFGAGAMENWGLVLYRETLLLFDANISSVHDKYSIAQVIGHELAHQWFGNLVTAAWWNEIWLNEGFASYVQYIAVEGVKPEYKPFEIFIIDDLQGGLYADSYSSSHPLVHPEGYFSTITYSKGASFLRMVQGFLGEKTFTNALTNYLNDLAYSSATHDVLFQHWIDQAAKDGLTFPYPLQDVFETWTLQMGYPLITVERIDASTIKLTQEYFLVDPKDSAVDTPGSLTYKYKWYVPFTYRGESEMGTDKMDTLWMDLSGTATLNSNENYILGNIEARGFYRINYDENTWSKLSTKLASASFKDIPVENRAQLIDDVFALSRATKIEVNLALELAAYLSQEDEYIPWYTFNEAMQYFDSMLGASLIYGDFSQYILDLVVPSLYNKLGWDDSNTDDNRMTRGLAIDAACYYGNEECIANAKQLFQEWMNDTSTIISSTYRTDVYCTAIREGGIAEWDFMWGQYLVTQNAQLQTSLRYGLSCSKDAWILNRYIEYAMDSTLVRKQDVSNTLYYISSKEHGKYVAWSFAANNWERLLKNLAYNKFTSTSLLSGAVSRFSTDFDLDLVESMKNVTGPGYYNTLESYKTRVQANIDWRARNEAVIADFLGSSIVIPTSNYEDKQRHAVVPEINQEPHQFHKHRPGRY